MVTIEETKKLAKLAKLRFSEEEFASIALRLTGIIRMIDDLGEVSCDNIEPLASVSDMSQRLVRDEVKIGDSSAELLANAPGNTAELAKEIKYFIVPKVIE